MTKPQNPGPPDITPRPPITPGPPEWVQLPEAARKQRERLAAMGLPVAALTALERVGMVRDVLTCLRETA